MEIVGVGTDIVNIQRIRDIFLKHKDDFLLKNFHRDEIICFNTLAEPNKVGYLARRFAAKEAIAKALGHGIGSTIAFKDISITNDFAGAPKATIDNKNVPHIDEYNIHISLSDDEPFAVAFVVISK